MHRIKLSLFVFFTCFLAFPSYGQFESIGLDGQEVEELNIYNDHLYAATDSGLYVRDLSAADAQWNLLGLSKHVKSLLVFSPDTILAGTWQEQEEDSVYMYKTEDGGENWTSYQNGFGTDSTSRRVVDLSQSTRTTDTLYATNGAEIFRSADLGQSWQMIYELANRLEFITANYAYHQTVISGGQGNLGYGAIYRSTDAGENWTGQGESPSDILSYNALKFRPSQPKVAFIVGSGKIKRTVDKGANWQTVLTTEDYDFHDVAISSERIGLTYAGGINTQDTLKLFKSNDGGDHWKSIQSNTIDGVNITAITVQEQSDREIVYLGTNMGVYRYVNTLTSFSDPKETPDRYLLEQNYPNPFNPTTNIRFSLPKSGKVQLTVYNTLGQHVKTLLDQRMRAGMHSVKFNGSEIPSGIYFYQMKVQSGEISKTRKMLLVK